MKCEDCIWWYLRISGKDIASEGDCLRFPPATRATNPQDGKILPSSWPSKVYGFDCCGEFKEKDNAKA